ncbi:MAG: S8 family serine peptidase [Caldisericia bacterium]|nr:S8 family serine peptidase [Caldisericia bacterium]
MFKSKLLRVVLAIVFSFGAVLVPFQSNSSYAGEGKKVLVYITRPEAEGFQRGGFDVIEIYETFSLFSVNPSEEEVLKIRNVDYEVVKNINKIFYGNQTFTSDGAKNMLYPEEVSSKMGTLQNEGLFLLQFVGPVKAEWVDYIESLGIVVYSPLQYSAYLVKATKKQMSSVKALSFVRTMGQVPGYLKVASELIDCDTENADIFVATNEIFDINEFVHVANIRKDQYVYYKEGNLGRIKIFDFPIASLPVLYSNVNVLSIEKLFEDTINNEYAAQVLNIRSSVNAVLLPDGNTGLHQIVAVADTGLSTGEQDATMHPNFGTNGDKVVDHYSYNVGGDPETADWSCFISTLGANMHGTHVAGSVLGDGDTSPGNAYRGMASGANLVVQNIASTTSLRAVLPPAFDTLFGDAFTSGAKIHTNSWGGGGNYYSTAASDIDTFAWDHKDFSILFAMGNSGPNLGTMLSHANAKNIISVGASQNNSGSFNPDWMASFSSRGLAGDGRIKPDVVTPGQTIYSSVTSGTKTSPNNTWRSMQGTSMATPVAAGALACIREFFTHGTVVDDYRTPSAALLKAAMINGCYFDDMKSETGANLISPDGNIGWGRVNVQQSIDPVDLKVKFYDHPYGNITDGLITGQSHDIQFSVASGVSLPMCVSLVWTDAPAGSGSGQALVNDLNLKLITPTGDYYYGNRFDAAGESVLNPASTDAVNNVEVIRIPNPAEGNYTLKVIGANIQTGYQPFAIAYSGNVFGGSEPEPPPVEEALRLKVNPAYRDALRGSTADYNASVTSIGVTGEVSMSLEFRRSGVFVQPNEIGLTYTITPAVFSISSGTTISAQISVLTSTSTPIGLIDVIVHASTATKSADPVTVVINVIDEPYFLMNFEPATVFVRQTKTGTTTINITPMFGFSEEVVFDDIYGMPENATISFRPMPTGPNTQYRSKVTITTTLDTPIGTYMVSMRGRNITTSRDVSTYKQFKLVVSKRVNVYKAEVYCKSVPETVDVGEEIKFRFQMKNTGNEPLINNMLVFHLDPNLEFMFSEPAANYSDGKLYMGIRDLKAGECYPYACNDIGYPGISDKDGDYIVINCKVKESKMNSGGASYQLLNKVEVVSDPAYKRTFSICPVTVRPKQAGEYPLYFKVYFENLDNDGSISSGKEVKVRFKIQGGSGDYLYSWDWADGSSIQDQKIGPEEIELTHSYKKDGIYRITIVARDSKGRYKKGEVILRVK